MTANVTMTILLMLVPLAYVIARVASAAYFSSKLEYNIKLMKSLTQGVNSTQGEEYNG